MSRQDYSKSRDADASRMIAKIDTDLQKVRARIASFSAALENDTAVRAHSHILQMSDAQINDLDQKVQADQLQLDTYRYFNTFFTTQKSLVQVSRSNAPYELGVFAPKNSIRLVVDTANPHAIADYFESVTHEYLHYTSYVSEKQRFTDSFFEEGLTEYFARRAIKDALHTSTNLGYPVQVQIIREMTNIIPESELADIYFTKDEARLERTLDRVYGENFYQNNQILFETLQYTSDPTQELKLANAIMKTIGGAQLTERDLVSSYSKL